MVTSTPGFIHFAVRDAGLLLLAWWLWNLFAGLSAEIGPQGDFVGLMLGALLCLCAHLVHEWGHLLGGFAAGSDMQPGKKGWRSLSLFIYNSTTNSKAQFMVMSVAGFAATGLVVWFAFTQIPVDYLASRILRGFAVLQVVLAIVLEMPLVVWALTGSKLPPLDKSASEVMAN